MTREEKSAIVEDLTQKIKDYSHFYIADTSELNAEDTSLLRRKCFEKEIKLMVVKNTLLKRALNEVGEEYEEISGILKNSTSIMFCNTGNVPAKVIKEFRKSHDKPVLKGAYVEESIYVGENQLDTLAALKSKDELIADVIAILQSPAKTVVSQLQSGGQTISGLVKTLAEREA
jgi:large subunit ribosomal protein L10